MNTVHGTLLTGTAMSYITRTIFIHNLCIRSKCQEHICDVSLIFLCCIVESRLNKQIEKKSKYAVGTHTKFKQLACIANALINIERDKVVLKDMFPIGG